MKWKSKLIVLLGASIGAITIASRNYDNRANREDYSIKGYVSAAGYEGDSCVYDISSFPNSLDLYKRIRFSKDSSLCKIDKIKELRGKHVKILARELNKFTLKKLDEKKKLKSGNSILDDANLEIILDSKD